MKRIIRMSDQFGTFCSTGRQALNFLQQTVMPLLSAGDEIIFDFQDIRHANSSFVNALFANLVMRQGEDVITKIKIRHCRPYVQTLICAGLEMGVKKRVQRDNNERSNNENRNLCPWSPITDYNSTLL
ncbi:MAG: STAS-like domain-containing protein [Chloroflexota bacterium]